MQTSERLSSPRAKKCRNGRAGSVLPSSMKAPTSAKSDVGWRFAPACCAAQSVPRARRRSAVQRSAPARCLGTSGVQNQFVGPRHRVGGAMRSLNQRLFRTSTPPRKSVAQFKCGASNSFKISAPSNQGQCWLTIRSTGHFAAHRRWASFHSRPNPAHRKMPVSSNVSHHSFSSAQLVASSKCKRLKYCARLGQRNAETAERARFCHPS